MHREFQEMRGAGDTRVIVADGLLAAVADDLIGPIEDGGGNRSEVRLDARLVLRGRRHDTHPLDRAVSRELVAVPADAARRLGAAETAAGARLELYGCFGRRVIGADDAQCLFARKQDFHRAYDDALERIA